MDPFFRLFDCCNEIPRLPFFSPLLRLRYSLLLFLDIQLLSTGEPTGPLSKVFGGLFFFPESSPYE